MTLTEASAIHVAHIISAAKFFYEQAGYSSRKGETAEESRERCARELAECELRALSENYSYQWCIDTDSREHSPTRSFIKPDYQLWSCTMHNDKGEQIESLWGIDFGRNSSPWRDPYRRVVEAELAQSHFEAEQQLLTGETT